MKSTFVRILCRGTDDTGLHPFGAAPSVQAITTDAIKHKQGKQNNGWMSIQNFAITETRASGLKVNNLALQFGIGLPF